MIVFYLIYTEDSYLEKNAGYIEHNKDDFMNLSLKCHKMFHFQWYKYTYLTRLYSISEANFRLLENHFISGLPKVFSKGAKTRIKNKNNGVIPCGELTNGEVILEIEVEGLEWCNQIKRNYQINKTNFMIKKN